MDKPNQAVVIICLQHHDISTEVVNHLQQQRVLADPLNGGEKVALQGNVCAFLPSK